MQPELASSRAGPSATTALRSAGITAARCVYAFAKAKREERILNAIAASMGGASVAPVNRGFESHMPGT
jgi:hypothetical protein